MMKLFGLAFLVGLLSVQGFPAGEIGVSHGISVDVFINTMLSSFSAVKGKDNCEGVVSVFQNILDAWKGKETFLTESFIAAFKTALTVKKAKETLIFHHAIDAFKTVLEVGKVKEVLISEGFLLAFKGALEAKKTVISEVFLKAFESGFWPGGKFLGNNNGSNSNISVEFFVKTMVSVFGGKDGVITESFIQTFTETFSKCKGGHADFISAWKKAFDSCKGKNKVVPIATFTLALKKESGWSFIPSDCLKAIKSPENAAMFPVGIKEKILSALFNTGGTQSDVSQNQPISPEGPKSSISVDFFVKTMVSVFGGKDGVITESFIQTFTETFSKCKGGHADFISAWKKAFDSCRGKNKVVPIAAFILALKKESGWSFIPSDCLKAIKSPENSFLFPNGIQEKLVFAFSEVDSIKSNNLQETPISGTPGDILTGSGELPSLLDYTPASSPSKSETPLEPSLESSDTTAPDNVDPIPANSDSASALPDNVEPMPASSDSTTTNSPITALFDNVEPMPANSDSTTSNSPTAALPDNIEAIPANSDSTTTNSPTAAIPDNIEAIPANSDSTTTSSPSTALFDNIEPKPANSDSATPGSDATKSNTVPDTPTPESLGGLGDKSVTPPGPNSASTATAKASSSASTTTSGGVSKASSVAKSVASGNDGKTTAVSESVSKTSTASGENSATASAAASATAGSSGSTANAASTGTSTTADKNPTHSKPCNKKSPILTPAKVIDAKSSIVAAGAAEIAAIIPGPK